MASREAIVLALAELGPARPYALDVLLAEARAATSED